MEQQNQGGVPGPAGRRLHIAHRKSPSELTPLMMEQLAIQQQIEALQEQSRQIAMLNPHIAQAYQQNQFVMGMQPQPGAQMPGFPGNQGQLGIPGVSPQLNSFQFPQNPPQLGVPMGAPAQPTHRRNQSAMPGIGMGPPPAPSSGASGSAFSDFNQQNRENAGGRGRGAPAGGGHNRRHSLALDEAKKAAELAQQKRTTAGFQFPIPGSSSSSQAQADVPRRSSQPGHARSGSRNFEGNWRQPSPAGQQQEQQPQPQPQASGGSQPSNPNASTFQPGHRTRGSINQSMGSLGAFQYPGQPQLVQLPQGGMVMAPPQMLGGQQLNALQIAQLQAMQGGHLNGQGLGLQASQHAAPQLSMQQQQQQQQRKTLFTPYLPQANLPALLAQGQLVAGILRVNKKNRSDAYVTTSDLDADIFICGSKDRNRALEGDLVAVELLDVDEVWGQKREKEEKKKRKDITDNRSGSTSGDKSNRNDATTNGETQSIAPDGSIRRRGSLRQRPTQKKNDDVEVEGQSLLLMEEEEISDEQKPLFAGHVVAVIERVAGQMFSGTLGLLRPSAQATKERQEAERHARDGGHGRHQQDRQQEKPKIVWFKPTDKRVPLIAIPTEQSPRDFVEKHLDYANRIFVACIKRWPITSLHPFGTLVEHLGEMGDLKVETDALLRDNNFASDEFSEAVLKNVGHENWTVANESEAALSARRDFRKEATFTIDPNGSKELDDALHVKPAGNGLVEVGFHVSDIAHFVKANSLVDREAKKRGTGVYLVNRNVNMLPPKLASEICSLTPGKERLTVSVVFNVDTASGKIEGEPWIGKSIIKSGGKVTYEEIDSVINGNSDVKLSGVKADSIKTLFNVANKFREERFGFRSSKIPALRLLYQLDDENIPVENNLFDSSAAHEIIEELSHKANYFVARKIFAAMPDKAFLRRLSSPNQRRLQQFAERMTRVGYEIDTASSGTLQNSLFKVTDVDFRKGMETLLVKAMQRAKYYVAGTVDEQSRQHFALNLPIYTHFTNPSRRYADIIVHRQLAAALSDGAAEFTEDVESLSKTAEQCNNKKDSARSAQEQSVHIESCRLMDKKSQDHGSDLIAEGIVICVYESAFDVLIPEYGFEKRVHCDQLPLKKAEFRKDERVLELYWEKGVPSSAYIPEDERPKASQSIRAGHAAARDAEAAKERAKEKAEAQRKQTDTGTMSTDDVDALFDDDDDTSEVTEMTAGVSLNERPTQSMPGSPTRNGGSNFTGHRTQSDSKLASANGNVPEDRVVDNKQKYLSWFKLREVDGENIQDVTEMTRVPIILKTDLSKSPPCLTIRSINPYAL